MLSLGKVDTSWDGKGGLEACQEKTQAWMAEAQ